MLRVKLLTDSAKVPTIAHPGEDLGYDLYSCESGVIPSKGHTTLSTGVAVEFKLPGYEDFQFGFIAKERSSLARKGIIVMGGCIDAGYRGELHLMLGNLGEEDYELQAGEKVANLIPTMVFAKTVSIVPDLTPSLRNENWNGSTGS